MSMAATLAAALEARTGSNSRLIRSARELWLARLLAEDDDSDSGTENRPSDDADHHSTHPQMPSPPSPPSPPTLPAALVTAPAPAPALMSVLAPASGVVDLTSVEDSGESSGGAASSAATDASRFLGIIVDDDDDDDDSDDSSDSDVIVTETALAPLSDRAPRRKRPRSEMAGRAEPELVVVETQVVEKPQATECPVCADACTASGPHRLVALKCGHLFGKQCIDRWMLTRKACPICNITVRKPDIRPLFSDHVAVVDNSGVAAMTEKFEAEQAKRIRLEAEVAQLRAQHQAEVLKLQQEALQLREALAALQDKAPGVAKPKPRWK